MQTSSQLRSAIKQDMRELGYNFSVLSEKSGISRGSLSLILVGGASRRSPMAFHHLTQITSALGLKEEAYFDLYVDECFFDGRPSRSRIKPFLTRCIELGQAACVERILARLEGDSRYLPLLFEIAEHGFKKEGTKILVERLFEYMLLHQDDRHSVEKAVCHYRLFMLRLNQDEENNSRQLNAFSPYRDNLPDELKMQSLLIMAYLCYNRMDAEELENLGDELISLCLRLFGTKEKPGRPFRPDSPLGRTFVFYYGQGYVIKQIALCEKGEFEAAQSYSRFYEDLSWLAGSDAEAQQAARGMTLFAQANQLGCRLLGGELEVLPDYVDMLELHPKETVSGLIVLLKTANRFGISVDEWLPRFPLDLEQMLALQDNAYYRQVCRNRFARLLYQFSIYHFGRGRFEESLQAALQSWELSSRLNNHRMFRLLASLTLMYSGQSEPEDL